MLRAASGRTRGSGRLISRPISLRRDPGHPAGLGFGVLGMSGTSGGLATLPERLRAPPKARDLTPMRAAPACNTAQSSEHHEAAKVAQDIFRDTRSRRQTHAPQSSIIGAALRSRASHHMATDHHLHHRKNDARTVGEGLLEEKVHRQEYAAASFLAHAWRWRRGKRAAAAHGGGLRLNTNHGARERRESQRRWRTHRAEAQVQPRERRTQ